MKLNKKVLLSTTLMSVLAFAPVASFAEITVGVDADSSVRVLSPTKLDPLPPSGPTKLPPVSVDIKTSADGEVKDMYALDGVVDGTASTDVKVDGSTNVEASTQKTKFEMIRAAAKAKAEAAKAERKAKLEAAKAKREAARAAMKARIEAMKAARQAKIDASLRAKAEARKAKSDSSVKVNVDGTVSTQTPDIMPTTQTQ